jgi:membrane protein
MSVFDNVVRPIDRAQQRWPWISFPYAVMKKFGDDQGGNLAALMSYYAFLSIFPLILLLTTVLAYVLKGNPQLQRDILNSALVDFPVIGNQLKTEGLQGHWYVLVVSAVISLWAARGIANGAQNAFNSVWNVPYARRPGFPFALLRSLGLLGLMGLGVILTGLLSGIGTATGSLGVLLRVLVFVASALINIAMFVGGFRLAIARDIALRCFVVAAVASAILWQALLAVGSILLAHQVRHQEELYGTFGVILGLLAWLRLQAQMTLYALEADVVRVRGLWPRSVAPPPLTTADRKAHRAYAEEARRNLEDMEAADDSTRRDAVTGEGHHAAGSSSGSP